MATLHIVRGLPGSGKSTFCHTHFPNVLLLETDMFMYQNGEYNFDMDKHSESINMIEEIRNSCMEDFKCDVCICGVFSSMKSMIGHILTAMDNSYKVDIVSLYTQFDCIHNVPVDAINRFKQHWVTSTQIKDEIMKMFPHYLTDIHFSNVPNKKGEFKHEAVLC